MTINILGYHILIYKPKHTRTVQGACKIMYDGHFIYLLDQDGRQLPRQLACSIIERLNEPTKAVVELIVDITELSSNQKTISL